MKKRKMFLGIAFSVMISCIFVIHNNYNTRSNIAVIDPALTNFVEIPCELIYAYSHGVIDQMEIIAQMSEMYPDKEYIVFSIPTRIEDSRRLNSIPTS